MAVYVEDALLQSVESEVNELEMSVELVAFWNAVASVVEAICLLKLTMMVTVSFATLTTVEEVGVETVPVGMTVSRVKAAVVEVAAALPLVSVAPETEAMILV